jgi:GNAT superfamily N-acetyltransferase
MSSSTSMIEAIEENGIEFLLALGRAAGAHERDEPEIQWVIGGSPIAYHNCVVRADLPSNAVDDAIAASLAEFRARGVPGSWHVGPSMRPTAIGERLLACGFAYVGDDIGMAVDLLALNENLFAPADLVIEPVRDDQSLEAWAHVLSLGFGEGVWESDWVRDTYHTIGLGDDVPWHHYLGHLDGEPVATTSLFVGAGAAGIYFVSTAPAYRRQGIGAAITLAALRDARELGYRVGVLGASEMGYPLYRRLGFEQVCRIGLYEWLPPTSTS